MEFCSRISPTTLTCRGRYKGLLRAVAQRLLPGLGRENQKKHYPKAERVVALEALRASVARVGQGARFTELERLGIVNPKAVPSTAVEGWGEEQLAVRFALLSAERWTSVQPR